MAKQFQSQECDYQANLKGHLVTRQKNGKWCGMLHISYKVPRLHKTCVMLPDFLFHKIKTPLFKLPSVPGNITYLLLRCDKL